MESSLTLEKIVGTMIFLLGIVGGWAVGKAIFLPGW